jgi:diguanylate cyclase (GGDEF)-like protein/PAS domain S-box-containing protein
MIFDQQSLFEIIDNLSTGLYIVDKDMKILFWNKAAEDISGFTSQEMLGCLCSGNRLNHVDANGTHLCGGLCPLAGSIRDGHSRDADVYMHHKDGHRIPVHVRTSSITNHKNAEVCGIELFSDISNQSATTLRVQELEKLALIDKLTQLANRHYIEKELLLRFDEKKRSDIPFGILFADIDHFKNFNDTYGHDIGDEVLSYVAGTFIANTRTYDIFGRWGGEEFIGIIRNITENDLEVMGNTLRMLVENSFIISNGLKINVTISMGATMVRDDDSIDSLIKRADALMYQSKNQGRNRLTLG